MPNPRRTSSDQNFCEKFCVASFQQAQHPLAPRHRDLSQPPPHRFSHTRPFDFEKSTPPTHPPTGEAKTGKAHALHSLARRIVHAAAAPLLPPCPCLSRLRTQRPERKKEGTGRTGHCLSHCRALYLPVNAHPAHSMRNFPVFSTVGNPSLLPFPVRSFFSNSKIDVCFAFCNVIQFTNNRQSATMPRTACNCRHCSGPCLGRMRRYSRTLYWTKVVLSGKHSGLGAYVLEICRFQGAFHLLCTRFL